MDHNATPSVEEAPIGFRDVEIIELYKILKFENMVGSGGEAKAAEPVIVNGNVETQKRG